MKLTEPTTAITDFILAAELFVFALLTLRKVKRERCVALWGIALLALAVSAFTGGMYHGFSGDFSSHARLVLWRISMASIVATLGFLIAAGVVSGLSGMKAAILLIATEIPVAFYFVRAASQFEPHIILQQSTLVTFIIFVALVLLYIRQIYAKGPESGRWILIGSMILFAGVWVQTLQLPIHKNFNENDLCHLIFMAGSFFLYRGGLLLRDHQPLL